ncbi:preprotein translocase subunit SecE [Corynebacterium uterequi]|uniref:Protein translocase subunit SecE n=1 Tax=Corynebacterium uterequi TaxID=1072256 RepID=A0A0G3HAF4_9CORY|nr:preprotein translocase subunit SecE [Corynebacterium uterequi]AKK10309.1 preprotein translocase, SecE subunit [Corynebacterium uterequi]
MTDQTPQTKATGRHSREESRPAGKRQLSGSSTVSASDVKAKAAASTTNSDSYGGGVGAFVPEVVSEMRKVIWPTGREMVTYTLVVFSFLIFMTALVWGVDQLANMGITAVLAP